MAEDDRIPRRRVWLTAGVGVIAVVAAVIGAEGVRRSTGRGDTSAPSTAAPRRAPDQIGIVEQTLIRDSRRGLDERERQAESLRHFGWVDRPHGVARIPIGEAMTLVVDPAFMRRAFPAALADAGKGGGP
jgi:hypothetical protein